MAGQKLELRQQQSLVMTQQLQQSIKLLQLSSLDLHEFIAEELEKNPFLQEEGGEAGTEEFAEPSPDKAEQKSADQLDTVELGDSDDLRPQEELLDQVQDDRWENSDWQDRQYTVRHHSDNDDVNILEQTVSETPTLKDHLLEHLLLSTEDMAQRLIGRHLIDLVDEAGYLPAEYRTLAEVLHCDVEEVDQVVELLQRCEPAGLCSRTLSECLAMQLREKDHYDPAMQALVEHLELLSRADYDRLEQLCGVDREDLRDMVAEIKSLNPKPGLQFSHEISQTVLPDVLVSRRKQDWHIELNPQTLPRVLVNQPYYVQISKHSKDKEDKKYLNEQLANANWLVKALDQRAKTMLKVSKEIVKQQENFFRYGIRYLKPLTLREVADAIEMHESTVSRVTSNKYMATPSGLYELKYFFTSSVQSAHGGDISSKTVQHLIKQMVDAENADAILSDDAIAEQLKAQGVDVARRTVAKYRDLLQIPSSTQRRRQHRNTL